MVDLTESHYSTGTATVAAGGTAVTGQGTNWAGAIRPGDLFGTHVGLPIRILSVDSNTSLTLAHEWPGGAQAAAPYEIQRTPYDVGYRKAIEDLVTGISEGNLPMFAALVGAANKLPYFDSDETMAVADFPGWARSMLGLEGGAEQVLMFESSGTMTTVPRSDLVSGANYDVQVETLAERSAYDGRGAGFSVLVANTGDGRAAIYTKLSDDSGDWSGPAYVTGEGYDLSIGTVAEVPYGSPPSVDLTPSPGGGALNFDLPKGMIIEPGTITTLGPGQDASWDWVPITGGYRVDLAIPQGETGDIDGVTPFWNTRITQDADAAAARVGLGLPDVTQAEAEGGSGTEPRAWSPERVAQAIAALAPDVPADLYRPSNILGTVSQSGGVPTGAIIERGSNANGEYVRYADGTQICIVSKTLTDVAINIAVGSIYRSITSAFSGSYPAEFSSSNIVQSGQVMSEGSINSNGYDTWIGFDDQASQAGLYRTALMSGTSKSSATLTVRMMAIGRWF